MSADSRRIAIPTIFSVPRAAQHTPPHAVNGLLVAFADAQTEETKNIVCVMRGRAGSKSL